MFLAYYHGGFVPKLYPAARLLGSSTYKSGVVCNPGSTGSAPQRDANAHLTESLEGRTFFSVAMDGSGWTHVTPELGDHQIYVSSSRGDDHNSGRSPDAPVKNLTHAVSLLRNKTGDQLLLARGDVWHDTFGLWRLSGKSVDEPMVIGAFGDQSLPRPQIDSGANSGIITGAKSDPRVNHLAIIGVHFYADTRDPDSPTFSGTEGGNGIAIVSQTDDLLIEDCKIESYINDVVLQDYEGPLHNVRVRRSVIVDAYGNAGGRSQGLYATGVDGLLLEDNVFDHNGWNERVPGAVANIFSHDAYLSGMNEGVVVRGNIFANASSHGLQARSGGEIVNNLFLNNPIGLSFGLVNGATTHPGGVSGQVSNNVFLGDRDINGAPRGWAMEIGNTNDAGTVISHNVIAHDTQGVNHAIVVSHGDGGPNEKQGVGINALTISDNVIYDWGKGIRIDGELRPGKKGPVGLNGLVVQGNDFQHIVTTRLLSHDAPVDLSAEAWSGNRYDDVQSKATWISVGNKSMNIGRWRNTEPTALAAKVDYVDASRTIETYSASIGATGATTAAFLAGARDQAAGHWQGQYAGGAAVDYIRAGFTEVGQTESPPDAGGGSTPTPDPVPSEGEDKTPPAVKAAKPPVVKKVRLKPAALAITFSADVSATLDAGDLRVKAADGSTIDLTGTPFTWIPKRRTATFVLTGLPGGRLSSGTYEVTLVASGITATDGTPLAADFVSKKPLRVR